MKKSRIEGMELSPLQEVKKLVLAFKRWVLVIILLILATLFLPLPESPFLLGGALAIILWLLKRYLS